MPLLLNNKSHREKRHKKEHSEVSSVSTPSSCIMYGKWKTHKSFVNEQKVFRNGGKLRRALLQSLWKGKNSHKVGKVSLWVWKEEKNRITRITFFVVNGSCLATMCVIYGMCEDCRKELQSISGGESLIRRKEFSVKFFLLPAIYTSFFILSSLQLQLINLHDETSAPSHHQSKKFHVLAPWKRHSFPFS